MEETPFRRLPAMDQLLDEPRLRGVIELYGRASVRVQARAVLDALRGDIAAGRVGEGDLDDRLRCLGGDVERAVTASVGRGLRRVINATGIFVHTNLGRAPLPRDAMAELAPLLTSYCDLEMDLESGRRSDRNRHVARLLAGLCGAESALVTGNNAGALVLVLSTLARGREVVVSRGELVEIGGSFRIPDILEASGARLVEVGTTNRTRIADYEAALGDDTALLLKVHTSNYRIRGFTEAAPAEQLVELGRRHGVPVAVDEGSGLLSPSDRRPLRDHDDLSSLLAAGCDVVCGSGDKILGGPQAGLLLGRAEAIRRCKKNPLYRALRPDRYAFAVLELVLRRHLAGRPLPLDRLWPDAEEHRARLERVAARLDAEVVEAEAFVGGGSAPDEPVPGEALALEGSDPLLAALRTGSEAATPVVGYLRDDRLVLDLRTVDPEDDETLCAAVEAARRRIR